jgi:hypothetical protein
VSVDVLTPVSNKILVSWDVMPSNLVDSYQVFGGACCLSLQGNVQQPSDSEVDIKKQKT